MENSYSRNSKLALPQGRLIPRTEKNLFSPRAPSELGRATPTKSNNFSIVLNGNAESDADSNRRHLLPS